MLKVICLDCEYNQPSTKTIQLAAVLFEPASGKVIDTLNILVNPGEPLNPEIIELTRISDDMLLDAPNIVEAANTLTSWKEKYQANATGIVWGAAKSNDIRHIYEEAGIESPFVNRIIDVKGVYQMLANSCNNNMRQRVGLKTALNFLGMEWDYAYGAPHDALADAWNTMRVYMFLTHCMKGGFTIGNNIRNLE